MAIEDPLTRALAGNKAYTSSVASSTPQFFPTLAQGQSPGLLWIGCADSRIPETTITASRPGDIFVHRNIANSVQASDASAAAVIEYAVTVLKVAKVVVCGHTKCGGANAALGDGDLGQVLNTWLLPLRELRRKNKGVLGVLGSDDERANRIAEFGVVQSVEVVKQHPAVMKAMGERGLSVVGLIFDIGTGTLRVLDEEGKKATGLWSPNS